MVRVHSGLEFGYRVSVCARVNLMFRVRISFKDRVMVMFRIKHQIWILL